MRRWLLVFMLILVILSMAIPTTAQEDATPVITAEVLYPEVNLRIGPSVWYDSLILLTRGTVVTVIGQREGGDWVYVVVEDIGLTGWMASELLYFSDREWLRTLAVMPYSEILTTFPQEPLQPPLRMTVQFYGSPARLLENPWYSSVIIAILPSRTSVNVIGRSGAIGNYVYVQVPDSGLEGWVAFYLLLEERNVPLGYDWTMTLPIMATPFVLEGQTIATTLPRHYARRLYLRSLPALDAPIITLLDESARLSVHGRSSGDSQWVYVTVVDSGESGWVFDGIIGRTVSIDYPLGFDRNSLPILPAFETPPLTSTPEVIPTISATTRTTTSLRDSYVIYYYRRHYIPPIIIPAGTTLILTGRTDDNRLFRTTYAGQEGWVRFAALEFQEAFNHLPIID